MQTINFNNATQFKTALLLSPVQYQGTLLLKLAEKWIERQGDIWPETLTAQTLIANVELVHVAYWLVSGEGSATWSASIGKERKRLTLCPTCKGGGIVVHPDGKVSDCITCHGNRQVEEEYIDWSQESGVVHHRIHQHRELNVSHQHRPMISLRGNPAHTLRLTADVAQQYRILPVESTRSESGRRLLEDVMTGIIESQAEQAAEELGQVKNLQVAYVTIRRQDIATWLYPIYIGTYTYEGEMLRVMIDGLTGEFWAAAPETVRQARRSIVLQWVAIIVFILGLLILMWMLYHWL